MVTSSTLGGTSLSLRRACLRRFATPFASSGTCHPTLASPQPRQLLVGRSLAAGNMPTRLRREGMPPSQTRRLIFRPILTSSPPRGASFFNCSSVAAGLAGSESRRRDCDHGRGRRRPWEALSSSRCPCDRGGSWRRSGRGSRSTTGQSGQRAPWRASCRRQPWRHIRPAAACSPFRSASAARPARRDPSPP